MPARPAAETAAETAGQVYAEQQAVQAQNVQQQQQQQQDAAAAVVSSSGAASSSSGRSSGSRSDDEASDDGGVGSSYSGSDDEGAGSWAAPVPPPRLPSYDEVLEDLCNDGKKAYNEGMCVGGRGMQGLGMEQIDPGASEKACGMVLNDASSAT